VKNRYRDNWAILYNDNKRTIVLKGAGLMKGQEYATYLRGVDGEKAFLGIHILLYLLCCSGVAVSLRGKKSHAIVWALIVIVGWGAGMVFHVLAVYPHIKKMKQTHSLRDEEVVAETIGRR
jgi:hypothetical protein